MNRKSQAILLFVLGGAVLRAGLTDVYLRYVRAGLRPLLLAGGAVLIVAAIATLWYELRPAHAIPAGSPEPAPDGGPDSGPDGGPDSGPDHGHGHGHSHGHGAPMIAWLLFVPVFALIVVVPPALGSYSADRTGTALQRPPGFPTLPAGSPLQMTVLDYATRAVYDNKHSLTGRQVEISGFIAIGGHGVPYLTRMVLSCCAADALPIKVALTGKLPPTLKPDSWLQVTGTYTNQQIKDEVNHATIPYIAVGVATPITPPHDQYE